MADSDGDSLTDGQEALQLQTNPLNPDTDGDGLIDSQDPDPHGLFTPTPLPATALPGPTLPPPTSAPEVPTSTIVPTAAPPTALPPTPVPSTVVPPGVTRMTNNPAPDAAPVLAAQAVTEPEGIVSLGDLAVTTRQDKQMGKMRAGVSKPPRE